MARSIVLHPNAKDLAGQFFGNLQAVMPIGRHERRRSIIWECSCVCGGTKNVQSQCLLSGSVTSCGCKAFTQNGYTSPNKNLREYKIWHSMIRRCTDKASNRYKYYGARDISVCAEWKDFLGFLSHFKSIPAPLSLERIDVNKDYTPDNCTLIPLDEQQKNKTTTIWVRHLNKDLTLIDLARQTGLPYKTLYKRYKTGDRDERLIRPVRRLK